MRKITVATVLATAVVMGGCGDDEDSGAPSSAASGAGGEASGTGGTAGSDTAGTGGASGGSGGSGTSGSAGADPSGGTGGEGAASGASGSDPGGGAGGAESLFRPVPEPLGDPIVDEIAGSDHSAASEAVYLELDSTGSPVILSVYDGTYGSPSDVLTLSGGVWSVEAGPYNNMGALVVDSNDASHSAYSNLDSGTMIQTFQYASDASSTWESIVIAGVDPRVLDMTLTADGTVHVIYSHFVDSGGGILDLQVDYAVSNGTDFTGEVLNGFVDPDATIGDGSLQLVVDANGDVHVFAISELDSALTFTHVTKSGGAWTVDPITLTVEPDEDHLFVETDADGNPVVLYQGGISDGFRTLRMEGGSLVEEPWVPDQDIIGLVLRDAALDSTGAWHLICREWRDNQLLYLRPSGNTFERKLILEGVYSDGTPTVDLELDDNDLPHIAVGHDLAGAVRYITF